MDINHIKRKVTGFLCCLFFLVSCIENDIPYPYREGSITDFLVEGQLDNTLEIDKTKGMVTVEVSDAVDLDVRGDGGTFVGILRVALGSL